MCRANSESQPAAAADTIVSGAPVVMYPLRRTVMVPDTCPIFFVGAGLMVAPYFLDF